MRRKITGMSLDHYHELLNYCANNDFRIYQERPEWLMFTAEVPDYKVETLRELDAAVNDDAGGYPVGEIQSLKKV